RGFPLPRVGALDLVAAPNLLPEESVIVVDSIRVAGQIERRHRIEVARREPAQAAVTERRVGLFIEQYLQVDSVFGQKVAAGVDNAEVEEVVFQRAPDQKFERQVVELLRIVAIETQTRREHLLDQHVANHQRGRAIPVVLRQIDPQLGQRKSDVMIDKLVEQVAIYF